MAKLSDFATNEPVKLLVVGDPGSGKTGALASLAKAGYHLHIADFDSGLDPLAEQLRGNSAALGRVDFITYADEYRKNRIVAKAASAFVKDLDGESPIGPIHTFDQQHVFVLDSLTAFAKAVMNEVLKLAGQVKPRIQDWGEAVERVERIVSLLCSPYVPCHVIVMAHLNADQSEDGGIIKYYPKAVTANQSRSISRFFNTVVQMKQTGSGNKVKRVLVHNPQPRVDLKCPFQNVPAEIPIDQGYLPFIEARKNT